MKKFFYLFGIVSIFFGFALFAHAASIFDITYPIAELGGCASQQECKVYCDDLAHKDACLVFAEKFGLVAKERVAEAKKLPALGPGGCKSAQECRAYCDNPNNEEICLAFAEKYGMKTDGPRGQEVAARARLIKEQGGPGNCQSQKECHAYCENPSNQKECLDFAEKHNLIDKKELKAARKVMEIGGPGNCRSKELCEVYCENPDNMMECVKFAEEHDLIDTKEAEMIKKMPPFGPGGCRGKACETYCDNPDHSAECLAFAEKNGLMPKEELERAKKLAGKPGPGGCRGQKECDAFCGNPNNQEACFQFAVDNDLMPREEIEKIKKMKDMMAQGGPGGCKNEKECRAYCENSDYSDECIEFVKKNNFVGEKEIKMMERGREMMKKTRKAGGPGGCQGPEECRVYCEKPENIERCLAFAVEQGGMDMEEAKDALENFARAGAGMPARVGSMGDPGDDFGRMRNTPQGMVLPPMGGFATSSDEHFKRFEQFRELEGQFRRPPEIMRGFQGPGGCKDPEECIKYCSDPKHRAECARANSLTGSGQVPSAGVVPSPGVIFGQTEPGSEKDFRKYNSAPIDFLQKCIEEGGTIEKSESSVAPRCFKEGGEEIRLMSGDVVEIENEMMRSGGEPRISPPVIMRGDKSDDARRCGPKPLRPVPQGCEGPICKDGHWDYECDGDFGGKEMPPQPTRPLGEQRQERVVCSQEYKPVCGANNRTYPNECFAKVDGVVVVKDGRCEMMNEEKQPSGNIGQGQPPIGQYQDQYAPVPDGVRPLIQPHQQQIPLPPQSRRAPDSFLSNLLQSFSQALKLK